MRRLATPVIFASEHSCALARMFPRLSSILGATFISLAVSCTSGNECDDSNCELACHMGNNFDPHFYSSLSCGQGDTRLTNLDFDNYGRPTRMSVLYSNGQKYSCSLRYDTLGFVVEASCDAQCASCHVVRGPTKVE